MTITDKITWSEVKKKFCVDLKEDGMTVPSIQTEFYKRFEQHPTIDAIKGVLSRYFAGETRGMNNKNLKSTKAKLFKEPAPTNFTVPLSDMERGMCYYTQDEGADMKLCGKPVVKGQNYCEECCSTVKPFGLITERKAG